MSLNLDRFEKFASKLLIKDRDSGNLHPLRFNPSQLRIMEIIRERLRPKFPLFLIFLKARRVGVSTWGTALLTAHALANKGANNRQIAQLNDTAVELFDMSTDFAKQLKHRGVRVKHTNDEIVYEFPARAGLPERKSYIQAATAKTVIAGRGMTNNALLLSEAAYYPGEQSFTSLINTVSLNPENIIILESTANAMEGPGATFFKYWQAAIRGDNGFIPIFLPWHEDPGSFLPEEMAADAPRDDYEKMLMKDFACTKGQIAWYRWALETKCSGSLATMRQEYPSSPEEAFIASGTPAFDIEEISKARAHVTTKPLMRGMIRYPMKPNGDPDYKARPTFHEGMGEVILYELPEDDAHYYAGVDAAKGQEDGDFAAMVIWNAETGKQAARWADRVAPEDAAPIVAGLCTFFNKAMVNVEFTGGWGYLIFKELRDLFHYSNYYAWRGRDDSADTKGRKSVGWETNHRSRRMLIDTFRLAIRRMDCLPTDEALVGQMARATMELGFRWEVTRGHDDIFMAGMLGWIAMEHYHIPHPYKRAVGTTMPQGENSDAGKKSMPKWANDPFVSVNGRLLWSANNHLKKLEQYNKTKNKPKPLQGI